MLIEQDPWTMNAIDDALFKESYKLTQAKINYSILFYTLSVSYVFFVFLFFLNNQGQHFLQSYKDNILFSQSQF